MPKIHCVCQMYENVSNESATFMSALQDFLSLPSPCPCFVSLVLLSKFKILKSRGDKLG